MLGDIQAAYSTEDLSALRAKVTPEMLSYFSDQLAGNASRGLINHVTDVKLLQGDLAEAWREGGTDYATVAMKFALKDSMVERASGRTVEGGEREGGHRIVDLHARPWRDLAALGHPADLMFDTITGRMDNGVWTQPISIGPTGPQFVGTATLGRPSRVGFRAADKAPTPVPDCCCTMRFPRHHSLKWILFRSAMSPMRVFPLRCMQVAIVLRIAGVLSNDVQVC